MSILARVAVLTFLIAAACTPQKTTGPLTDAQLVEVARVEASTVTPAAKSGDFELTIGVHGTNRVCRCSRTCEGGVCTPITCVPAGCNGMPAGIDPNAPRAPQ
jgi:hypothetical protein